MYMLSLVGSSLNNNCEFSRVSASILLLCLSDAKKPLLLGNKMNDYSI